MTYCTGCNVLLGLKKYNFQKQWRVPGYFCKNCMDKLEQDWDIHGTITLPKKPCIICHKEFFFLTTTIYNNQNYPCCNICKDFKFETSNDTPPNSTPSYNTPPIPPKIPMLMAIFAAFGVLLMIAGFAYVVFVAPQQDFNILHIILGSSMSGAGFMLARKMVKIRNVILRDLPSTTRK